MHAGALQINELHCGNHGLFIMYLDLSNKAIVK